MTRLILCLLALSLPTIAAAKEKAPKPSFVQPLLDELATRGELSKDQSKALKAAHRCIDSDRNWERGQDNQLTPTQLYEAASGAVVCWQGAEKKATKLGEAMVPATGWIAARARYLEAYRDYLWAIEAKLKGDRIFTCKRLVTAMGAREKMVDSHKGLAESFTVEHAQGFGALQTSLSDALAQSIEGEHGNQKCE